MRITAIFLLVVSITAIGFIESIRLKMRVHELEVFCDALNSMRRAAAYTAGDLRQIIYACRDNPFMSRLKTENDPIESWMNAAKGYFSNADDAKYALDFIQGYGHSDLSGLISYIEYFEKTISDKLLEAKQAYAAKGKLYTILGLFLGTAAAILIV